MPEDDDLGDVSSLDLSERSSSQDKADVTTSNDNEDTETEADAEGAAEKTNTEASQPSEKDQQSTTTPTDPLSEPAFSSDVSKQRPVYLYPSTDSDVEDLLFNVESELRSQYGISVLSNSKREIYDAVFQVVKDMPEEIAEQVVAKRRQENS